MSELLKISSTDAKNWLEKETGSIFIPVHEKARELLDKMNETLENVTDICKMLLENSEKEIERRNKKTYRRARALNKLARLFIDRIRQIEVPNEVSYDSFHDFVQETAKAFVVTEVDIRNWFPRISPFFIMDRRKFLGIFEKAKESLKELQSFLKKEYIKTKTLEETFQLIENLLTLEGQLADSQVHKQKNETGRASIEMMIDETQQKIMDLKNRDSLTELNQISKEMEKLDTEVKHNMRHLRKPFIKFQSQVFRKGGLTPEELETLNQYVENPFAAFATEESGYPILRQILRKLAGSISEGKLKLKHDRKRKAEQAIDRIFTENSLDSLHKKCSEVIVRKKQLSTSDETVKIRRNLLKYHEDLKKLERKIRLTESEEKGIEQNMKKTLKKMHNHKKRIESNVLDSMGKRIRIKFKVQ